MHPEILEVNCLCGFSRQTVVSRRGSAPVMLVSDLEEDRHGSGVLLVSYHPIEEPNVGQLARLSSYDCGKNVKRFFCGKCGCHIFKSTLPYRLALRAPSPLSTTATIGGDTPAPGSPRYIMSQRVTPVGDDEPADDADSAGVVEEIEDAGERFEVRGNYPRADNHSSHPTVFRQ